MGFIFCFNSKERTKLYSKGSLINTLLLSISVCKYSAEKLAVEKEISQDKAMKFVLENIWESYTHKQ